MMTVRSRSLSWNDRIWGWPVEERPFIIKRFDLRDIFLGLNVGLRYIVVVLLRYLEHVREWRNGRRARLRILWVTVGVQVPPLAPFFSFIPQGVSYTRIP